jgi:predicted ATPase
LFKHALLQDAAYGTLLREGRRALHARIAEVLESQCPDAAESQPELLAHHCTEAGLIDKAAKLWGKAGQRSLERSALVEAAEQLTRALGLIATLPGSPVLRHEEIKLQVALITPLLHVKGFAAHETTAAAERARLLIERAEALGETPEDPLLLYSVLYGFIATSLIAFNGDTVLGLAAQFLSLAEKQKATIPLMMAHRLMGVSLLFTGRIAEGRKHYDRAIAFYDHSEHRSLATRFGQDFNVTVLSFRSLLLWVLGYPGAALEDSSQALKDAREIGHDATLMLALTLTTLTQLCCGDYAAAGEQTDEVVRLADERSTAYWKAYGTIHGGCVLALSGNASSAVDAIASGIAAYRSLGSTMIVPFYLLYLAKFCADVGQLDDAWCRVDEALVMVETTKEKWCEAEVHRIAGEIALISPERNAAEAEAHFNLALTIARTQQAKSWELRAAMSMARLWRDQGKRQQAYDLLAPVYGWFTEGFDTLDLEQARTLLDELAH